jgi:membrane-associated phospholipid phosphatase
MGEGATLPTERGGRDEDAVGCVCLAAGLHSAACLTTPVGADVAAVSTTTAVAARERLLRACHMVNAAVASPPERRSVHAFRQRPLVYGAMLAYAIASIGLMFSKQVGITSEHVIILALVAFALVGRARPFVWDWLPFLFVAVMFEDLTSVGAKIAGSVHVIGPIVFEKTLLGGVVATTWLQARIGTGFFGTVLSIPLTIEYLFHFAAPLVAGMWLWVYHRDRFGSFVSAYILVMTSGFIAYLLYPEMPPWLAAQQGQLPQVHRIAVELLQHLGGFGSFYAGADPEPNAAMPSLHVTVPLIVSLAIISVKGYRNRRAWLWLLYPITIGFGVVYLGEHYIADVVVGLALGVLCWLVAEQGRVHGLRRQVTGLATAAVTVPVSGSAAASRRPERR